MRQLLSLEGNSLEKDVGIVTGDDFPGEGDLGGTLKHQLYHCCFQHCHSRLQNLRKFYSIKVFSIHFLDSLPSWIVNHIHLLAKKILKVPDL